MKHKLSSVVFLCGASTMIMELVGSRIVAPYVGTSIFVWTNLIGVILGFLSLGYYWGGLTADKDPREKTFSHVILASAVWIALIALIHDPVLTAIQWGIGDVRLAALAAAVLLFAVPSVLLGMVLPYAVKIKTRSLDETGATVGGLYALSTAGSIAGTFLAGFVLLSYLGNTLILFMLSALLALASLAASSSGKKAKIFCLVSALLLSAGSDLLASTIRGPGLTDRNTPYSRVWIYDLPAQGTGLTFRCMQINDELSSMKLEGSDELITPYLRFYRLSAHFFPEPKKALMLGGAAYSYPRDFLKAFPSASIEVVEIDPGVTKLAVKYFDLKDDPRLLVNHQDARTFLNRNTQTYDVIFSDVFRSDSIPFHLTTSEAIAKLYGALTENGVLLINVISGIDGPRGEFLRAEVATLKKYFPQVYVFAVSDAENGYTVQNLMVAALKTKKVPKFYSRDPEMHGYLQHLWIKPIAEDVAALTDDFAPVDRYSLSALRALKRLDNPILAYWRRVLGLKALQAD